ncbi:MAG: DUF58 domain-containing protein [Halobacteriovoraceae bacterium]|nr:DUF58 domain-containing protein [Halobacteriovoraceae bacterium]
MNLVEIEKVVSQIQNQLFKKANSYSIGLFKSNFRGAGLQFREHQIYTPGDDVRFIDWKLSARSADKTFIKTFEEERNLEIVCMIDFSPTIFMGYKDVSKLQAALEIVCLLYLLTKETKDKVKLILLLDDVIQLPVSTGKEGIIQLISYLEKKNIIDENGKIKYGQKRKFDLDDKKKLTLIKSYVARKKETLYFSDFLDFSFGEEFFKMLYNYNFHCFRLSSPLDDADSVPYSFKAEYDTQNFYFFRKKGIRVDKKIEEEKRIKKLDVSERYLEDFVKKMV